MNTRQIQPKTIWTASGEKTATIFALTNFSDYHFDNGTGSVVYRLIGMESPGTSIDVDGALINLPDSAVEYYIGKAFIPAEVIQQWGASDDIIFDFVAQQLGLTIINN
jgi:hypothetical protein